jgi:hypothetical protein
MQNEADVFTCPECGLKSLEPHSVVFSEQRWRGAAGIKERVRRVRTSSRHWTTSGTALSNVRLIRHEVTPGCGSFEVRFDDGRPSVYFYFEDLRGRRLRPDLVDSETAVEEAKAFARALKQHYTGKLRLFDVKEMFAQMRDHA